MICPHCKKEIKDEPITFLPFVSMPFDIRVTCRGGCNYTYNALPEGWHKMTSEEKELEMGKMNENLGLCNKCGKERYTNFTLQLD